MAKVIHVAGTSSAYPRLGVAAKMSAELVGGSMTSPEPSCGPTDSILPQNYRTATTTLGILAPISPIARPHNSPLPAVIKPPSPRERS